ncbi:MAG: hypothetical protein CR988_06435 [Treponema sp.]|nr:MAG: hypothetical protein CR988_06435 [Treponema sp.]
MNLSELKNNIKKGNLNFQKLDDAVLEEGYSGYLFHHLFSMQCIICSAGCSNARTIGDDFGCNTCSQGCTNSSCAKCAISQAAS